MQIICPYCQTILSEKHIDPDANMVVCDTCDTVFSTPSTVERQTTLDDADIPYNMSIQRDGYSLRISYPTESTAGTGNILSAVLFLTVISMVFISIFSADSPGGWARLEVANFNIGGIVFPLLTILIFFAPVGLYLLYALSEIINIVTIEVKNKSLTISHHPIPFPLNKVISSNSIDQIYTKQSVIKYEIGENIIYSVHLKHTDGTTRKLVGNLTNPENALYIEREIENFLDIEDRDVAGEYSE